MAKFWPKVLSGKGKFLTLKKLRSVERAHFLPDFARGNCLVSAVSVIKPGQIPIVGI